MPKLNTFIEVGFCSGYGDGDYRVSASIAEMDNKQYDELRLAVLGAIRCADNMRRRHREKNQIGEYEPAATTEDTTHDPR